MLMEFAGEMYNDDRLFVLYVCRGTRRELANGAIESKIYHDEPPADSNWCVVTFRNTPRYKAFRVDHFGTLDEAEAYRRFNEPLTPRISLGGMSPSPPLSYAAYSEWKHTEALREYDHRLLFRGGMDRREIITQFPRRDQSV